MSAVCINIVTECTVSLLSSLCTGWIQLRKKKKRHAKMFKTQYRQILYHIRRVLHSVQPIRASFSPSTAARVRMFCLAEARGRVFITLNEASK